MIPGCQCEECRARWIADLVEYAAFLEETVRRIERLLPPRGPRGDAIRVIKGLAMVAERRDSASSLRDRGNQATELWKLRRCCAGPPEPGQDTAFPSAIKLVPSTHIRCMMTASLRATATLARRSPMCLASASPQLFKAEALE